MVILAVDNDLKALFRLMRCLETVYPESEIEPFYDPMLAIKYAYNNRVDMIFTEIDMKRMNGIQVKSMIRKGYGERIKVFFVTRTASRSNAVRLW